MLRAPWTVDVRTEIARARDELRTDIGALGSALAADTAGVRRDLSAFQRQVTFIVAAFALGLLGLLGAGQF